MRHASGTSNGVDESFAWRVHAALVQVIDGLCEDAPVIVALDDAPWCDPESATLLQMIMRRPVPVPVLWIATEADDEPLPPTNALWREIERCAVPVELPPLSPDAVCGMLAEFSGEAEGWETLASAVHAVSHGVPGVVCAAIDELRATTGDDWQLLRTARPAVPRLHPRLRARVDALPELAREMLLVLSLVMERDELLSFDAWHAQPVLSLDALSHTHGISRLRVARTGSQLVEARLAVEHGGGFRCASPSVAAHLRATGSSVAADEFRRILGRTAYPAGVIPQP
ncbi:MAG TPA: hypothetical protein VE869_05280 [Gemmatimonas sp.]|nr:hypothetical protein [Gemmatimonas sp.]